MYTVEILLEDTFNFVAIRLHQNKSQLNYLEFEIGTISVIRNVFLTMNSDGLCGLLWNIRKRAESVSEQAKVHSHYFLGWKSHIFRRAAIFGVQNILLRTA